MVDERRFLLFVNSDYSFRPVNPLAPADTRTMDVASGLPAGSSNRRSHSRLPDFNGITYTFPKMEKVQNFYHMDDFMIISEQFKDALAGQFGPELEVSPVRIQHEDGAPPWQPYFAVRVKTVIDCIDPDLSSWRSKWGEEIARKFSDGLSVSLLDERDRKEFANGGGAKYISYPSVRDVVIGKVQLIEERIPPHAVLFQPKYWPGHWIIESNFAHRLERLCAGGTHGYYFWGLSLNDVDVSHRKHLFDLR